MLDACDRGAELDVCLAAVQRTVRVRHSEDCDIVHGPDEGPVGTNEVRPAGPRRLLRLRLTPAACQRHQEGSSGVAHSTTRLPPLACVPDLHSRQVPPAGGRAARGGLAGTAAGGRLRAAVGSGQELAVPR